uniref:INVERT_DEFENSINS domain-containing protein n=1 Tax=Parastrongyloides trichosuri TaxID=131310 RepID=A0A0N4ZDL9_PARTI
MKFLLFLSIFLLFLINGTSMDDDKDFPPIKLPGLPMGVCKDLGVCKQECLEKGYTRGECKVNEHFEMIICYCY